MLTNILIALAVVVLLFIVAVASRPSTFRIMRSATIAAPPQEVFMQVRLQGFRNGRPGRNRVPGAEPPSKGRGGSGRLLHWSGNKKVGEGRIR